MLKMFVFWPVFIFYLIGCKGSPIAGPQENQAIQENENQPNQPSNSEKLQQLYSLLNESLLMETISEFSVPTNFQKDDQTIPPNSLTIQSSTERLYTSKPNLEFNGEDNSEPQETKITPQIVSFILKPEQSSVIRDRIEEITNAHVQVIPNLIPSTKSPLEYQSQRPSFVSAAGGISGGHLGQSVPSGEPLPANPPKQNISIKDRIKETTVQELPKQKPSTKSPLEYQFQLPTFAGTPGGISGGHLGQLISPGNPLPAGPPEQNITIEDRIKETTTTIQELPSQKSTTKSPLEYQCQRPTYAGAQGGISGGHLGQLIPSGDPLPASPPEQNITIEDRIKETTTTIQELPCQKSTTKSPLEYQSQRPTYAGAPGGISGGHLGQLIPSGDPLPASPPEQNITIEDRIKETTTTIQELPSQKPTTKSPLEYQSQRPTYAGAPGGISGGYLGQLIPSGDPLPANPPKQNINIQDRIKEPATTVQGLPNQKPSTKSPLEYQSQRPTFAGAPGGISGGHLGQLIPPGNPLPASPPEHNIIIEDRIKETTTTIQELPSQKPSTKSPLEYQSQRPTYAGAPGGISGGYLGQLIPSGDPLPSNPPKQNINIQDRIKEPTTTVQGLPNQKPSTKSPLEYQSQRPTFAGAPGGISGGHLSQLIPPGNPLPASPPELNIIIEDRIIETTTTIQELPSQKPSTKSPLEYQSQRPTYAGAPGGISGGYLGQLIPSGDPLPSNPPKQNINIQDRIKEPTTTVQGLPNQKPSTKSPLEYQSQRPTFAGAPGGISGGHLSQLIPPGNPLPVSPPEQNITIEDRIKETTTTIQELPSQKPSTKSPLEYQSRRPTFAGAPGGISGGQLGQLIPSGNRLPASSPEQNITIEDRIKETPTTTVQGLPSQKPSTQSPLEYQSQRPTFAGAPGGISGGHLGQLIPSGYPLPAGLPEQNIDINIEDRVKEPIITTLQSFPNLQTFSVAYIPQQPSYAGQLSSGYLGQLIPPGKPWPAS